MEAARAAGASDVLVTDVVERKLDVASDRGADLTIDVTSEDLGAAVREYTGGLGADAVIEASGAAPSIQSTLEGARRGGTVVFVGLASDPEVPLDVVDIVDNELDVHGSFRYKNTYPAAVALLADGAVDLAGMVDFESPLEAVADAFERSMEPDVVKGVITVAD
jgi:L-iditol 2-dehydrogenase